MRNITAFSLCSIGILLILSSFIVGIGAAITCIVWGIMDIITMSNGEMEPTFWNIFGVVFVFLVREFVAVVVMMFVYVIGLALYGIGTNITK